MQVAFIILAVILLLTLLLISTATLYVLFDLQKQQACIYRLYKIQQKDLKPIFLFFLQQIYNTYMDKEEYKLAGDILNIMKKEYPEECKKTTP